MYLRQPQGCTPRTVVQIPWRAQTASRPRRNFHSSRPNRLLNEALQASHTVFQSVHDYSGLSWSLSIPLTAVLWRLAWMPVHLLTDRSAKKRASLQPLLVTYKLAYRAEAWKKFGKGSAGEEEKTAKEAMKWISQQLATKRKEMEKRHVPITRLQAFGLQLSFLPIWLLNSEVVRRMTGDDRSWLSILTSDDSKIDSGVIPVEPSFLAEGALWVPNLVAADPLWLFPLTFVGLQYLSVRSIFGAMNKQPPGRDASPLLTSALRNFAQLMLAVPFVGGFFLIHGQVSVAVVLYLIGSVSSMILQRGLIGLTGKPDVTRALELKAPQPIPSVLEMKKQAAREAARVRVRTTTPDLGLRTKRS